MAGGCSVPFGRVALHAGRLMFMAVHVIAQGPAAIPTVAWLPGLQTAAGPSWIAANCVSVQDEVQQAVTTTGSPVAVKRAVTQNANQNPKHAQNPPARAWWPWRGCLGPVVITPTTATVMDQRPEVAALPVAMEACRCRQCSTCWGFVFLYSMYLLV